MTLEIFGSLFKPRLAPVIDRDASFEKLGLTLKNHVNTIFGRSLAIRDVDSGSDNAVEIELNNLTTPYYDIEHFGVSFVASPRHADVMVISGAITHNMAVAVKKTFEAMPQPRWVVAVGDDACGLGLVKDSYAVLGAVEKLLPVDLKIPGNPP